MNKGGQPIGYPPLFVIRSYPQLFLYVGVYLSGLLEEVGDIVAREALLDLIGLDNIFGEGAFALL